MSSWRTSPRVCRPGLWGLCLLVASCLDWGSLQVGACGDSFVGPEESCDDGNLVDGDGCSATCRIEPPYCGDGRTSAMEGCDDANTDDGDGCLTSCVPARCGDGFHWQSSEECDDGNLDSGDGCSSGCTLEPPPELCGNGVLDQGEACDDGNSSNGDYCLKGCSIATCGDGYVRQGVEECDDGNRNSDDGCTRNCMLCELAGVSFFRPFNNHCYDLHLDPLPREKARAACRTKAGDLWTINGEPEESEIIAELLMTDGRSWIGLKSSDDLLSWVSGETPPYQNFADGEPSQTSDCISTLVTAGTAQWQATTCMTALPFVCERNPPFIFASTHHAFRVMTVGASFSAAAQACADSGGYLATLNSDDERSFVAMQVFPSKAWVGASDSAGENRFVWLDGQPVAASFFAAEEPSGSDPEEDCVALANETLADELCTLILPYVCEYE